MLEITDLGALLYTAKITDPELRKLCTKCQETTEVPGFQISSCGI